MAYTEVEQNYLLKLTSQEYRLVTMALAGILKDEEDKQAALALNTKLCEQRTKALKNQHEVAYEAMCKAQLLENPSVPPTQKKG